MSPNYWNNIHIASSESKLHFPIQFEVSKSNLQQPVFQKFKTGSVWEKIHNSPNINPKIMKPVLKHSQQNLFQDLGTALHLEKP